MRKNLDKESLSEIEQSGDLLTAQTDIVQICSFPSAHIYHAVNYCDYAQFFGNAECFQSEVCPDSTIILLKSPISGILFLEVFRLSEELNLKKKGISSKESTLPRVKGTTYEFRPIKTLQFCQGLYTELNNKVSQC